MKVYVKFSNEQAGLKAMRSSYLGRQNSSVPIQKREAEIPIKKESASPSIKHNQFLLILAWVFTVYKVQIPNKVLLTLIYEYKIIWNMTNIFRAQLDKGL